MKIFLSFAITLLATLSFLPQIDAHAYELLDASFERAMIAFGLAKGLNGIISLLQGTELTLAPVGVGVNLSIGEILDPFNDLVERFSWVMLAASVSLGVQKLLLALSTKMFVKVLVLLGALFALATLWMKSEFANRYRSFAVRTVLVLLLLRFFASVFVQGGELLYQSVLQQEFTQATMNITKTHEELEQFKKNNEQRAIKHDNSISSYFKEKYDTLKASMDIQKRYEELQRSIQNAYGNIINLITIFVFQTILMPLLFFYLLIVGIRYIFRKELSFTL